MNLLSQNISIKSKKSVYLIKPLCLNQSFKRFYPNKKIGDVKKVFNLPNQSLPTQIPNNPTGITSRVPSNIIPSTTLVPPPPSQLPIRPKSPPSMPKSINEKYPHLKEVPSRTTSTYFDDCFFEENSPFPTLPVPIPVPPPLPPASKSPQILSQGNHVTELQSIAHLTSHEALSPSTVKKQIIKLREKGLLSSKTDEEKLTAKYYALPHKKTLQGEKVEIDIDKDILQNTTINFNIGLVTIQEIEDTVLLTGIHTHVVLIYVEKNNKKIVWSFLTSDKGPDNMLLSNNQPFSTDVVQTNKDQMLCVLKEPFVLKDENLSPLPFLDSKTFEILSTVEGLTKDQYKDQQEIGQNYINQEDIKKKLKNEFEQKSLPILKRNNMLNVYSGVGLTSLDLENALILEDNEAEKVAKKFFNKYKSLKNEGDQDKIDNWLSRIEMQDKSICNKLKELIKNNENNNN